MDETYSYGYTGDYSERVARGVALLDEHFGNGEWRNRIDKDNLHMSSNRACVLGQLFARHDDPWGESGYEIGISALGIRFAGFNQEGTSGYYGFVTDNDDFRLVNWNILRDAWLAVL